MSVEAALDKLRSKQAYCRALVLKPWLSACTRLILKSLSLQK